ncbi:serine/threonine protein kinase [Methylohalobius crimeensis]|uniref:serine/threonine protein kinase n=1 Tax=Methylohalobius crimeensis TaxID=244365 RepID=UPI0003B35B33|nr:serine/threonine-protein kinase [Methylohalobius crimeensis]
MLKAPSSTDAQDQAFVHLPLGTVIDHYVIERPLADGGFSAVYLARHLVDQTQVAIKEYLPRKLAYRNWEGQVVPHSEDTRSLFLRGRRLFVEEARMLATLKHPNIVEVTSFFHANDTVYMVMTYDYGKSLGWYMKRQPKRLDGVFFLAVIGKLLQALAAIHRHGFLHLDLKPENILIRPGNDPLLLDFGAAQPYPKSKDNWKRPGKIRTPGFSPPEQYRSNWPLGPWSDLYGLGATLRTCLDRRPPPMVTDRLERDTLKPARRLYRNQYPGGLLEAIDRAMQLDPANRPQSVAEFESLLTDKGTVS